MAVRDLLGLPTLLKAVSLYVAISAIDIVYFEVMPLWAIATRARGGLGLDSSHVGYLFVASGCVGILGQFGFSTALSLAPRLVLWRLLHLFWAAAIFAVPFLSQLSISSAYPVLIVVICFRQVVASWTFSISFLCIAGAAPKEYLGSVNGVAQQVPADASAVALNVTMVEARAAGFDNINLDLMFALPGQSLEMAASDLASAVALAPEHLSLYQLTLEPNTVFHKRPPPDLPDDELSWDMQEAAFRFLADAGYRRYEISAFARVGRDCRHNRNYWLFGDYLAVGAGAHGKLTMEDGRVLRYRKPAHPETWMECAERGDLDHHQPEVLAADDLVFEFMLNALRLPEGFRERDFCERTGLSFELAGGRVNELAGRGLLEQAENNGWRPTGLGLRFLNELQAHFLPASGRPD